MRREGKREVTEEKRERERDLREGRKSRGEERARQRKCPHGPCRKYKKVGQGAPQEKGKEKLRLRNT